MLGRRDRDRRTASAVPQPWPDRTWVPPVVAHLLGLSVVVVLLLAGSLLLQVGEHGGVDVGGRTVQPLPHEVGLLGLAILPLVLPFWLAAAIILAKSTLWDRRIEIAASWMPLWTALLLGLLPALGLGRGGSTWMMEYVAVAVLSVLILSGWVLVLLWRRGTRAARRRAGLPE